MAVSYSKIRVGAPDSMLLDAYTTSQADLGASMGGATFAYNATYLAVEIDQTIMPVAAYKTKEDILFSVALVQEQSSVLLGGLSLATDLLSTAVAGTLASPGVPVLSTFGTAGTASIGYQLAAVGANGDSIPCAATTITTAPTTLTSTNGVNVQLPATLPAGTYAVRLIRASGGPSQGLVTTLPPTPGLVYQDTGAAATAYTAAIVAPATPNLDTVSFGGRLATPTHTFDWTVPKNDGTLLHWRGHLNRVFSSKQVTLDYKRDKVTEIAKVELMALADTTQAVGRQAGYVAEEYVFLPLGLMGGMTSFRDLLITGAATVIGVAAVRWRKSRQLPQA